MSDLSRSEAEAILSLSLMASFADGEKHERERQQIKSMAESLSSEAINVMALYQRVLLNKPDIASVVAQLGSEGARQLAYEMAVAVCDADDVTSPAEQQFLQELKQALGLTPATTAPVESEATALALVPVTAAAAGADPGTPAAPKVSSEETDAMVLKYAVLCGALELLPQTMATLAIVPLQTKMVYRIGSQRGVEMDKKAIAELMATVGLGLTSQVFEGFARKLAKGLLKKFTGKMGGSIGDAATGIAMSFASTYALGQVAKTYYDSGRTLSIASLKEKFPSMLEQGKALAQKYSGQIAEKSQQLKGADLTSLVKGGI